MESIEKLRYYIDHAITHRDQLHERADEIEREIAERYMELPVDADGVPCFIRDKVIPPDGEPFDIRAFQYDVFGWFAIERLGSQWNVNQLRHVKPRTVEDVLDDLADEIIRQGHQAGLTAPGIIAKYADELRSMGVGE